MGKRTIEMKKQGKRSNLQMLRVSSKEKKKAAEQKYMRHTS